MSCTSAISAQLIGVSTVISYDVFKTYFRPNADDRALLNASHGAVIGFSLFMAGFASMLFGIGVDLSLIYNMTGIFTGPGASSLRRVAFAEQPPLTFPLPLFSRHLTASQVSHLSS